MTRPANNQTTYVYRFTNLVNGKAYVGISTQPKKRKRDHESGNGSLLLWRAIQKYGLVNFEYSLVSKHKTYSAALSLVRLKRYPSTTQLNLTATT
jgi:predicted GIY-YIG superfamily endonuclease